MFTELLTRLAVHELDVVFADSPASSLVSIRAFNHALGECGIGIFGAPELCERFSKDLPTSLAGAPFVMPAEGTLMRRSVDQWVSEADFHPEIVGEMDDTALMKVFAEAGIGFIPAPLAIRKEIEEQFGLGLLMVVPGAIERFYAITVQRRLQHPAVVAISQAAKSTLFGSAHTESPSESNQEINGSNEKRKPKSHSSLWLRLRARRHP